MILMQAEAHAARLRATQGGGQQTGPGTGDRRYAVYEPEGEDAAAQQRDRRQALARAAAAAAARGG